MLLMKDDAPEGFPARGSAFDATMGRTEKESAFSRDRSASGRKK